MTNEFMAVKLRYKKKLEAQREQTSQLKNRSSVHFSADLAF